MTLSQVRGWDTAHLEVAARHWSTTANRWEEAFSQLVSATHMPGGTPWEGAAARAAQDRAHADRQRVRAVASRLHAASIVATGAANETQVAQRRVLAVVAAAEAAGFTVGDDFSLTADITDARDAAKVEARMRELGSELRYWITQLIDLDQQVADRIRRATDGVGNLNFTETDDVVQDRNGAIQAVDNRVVKEAPPQPVPPDPTPGPLPPVMSAEDVRRVLEPLQNGGRRGPNGVGTEPEVKEIWDEPSTRRLWDYLTRNASEGAGPPKYKGAVRVLPDGTSIGFRSSGRWGDSIDVWYPDLTSPKTHTPYEPYFPPFISGPPQFPPAAETPSVQVIPQQLTHPPTAMPPSGIIDPNGLPLWLQDPSTPPLHVPVQRPTILPGVAFPEAPHASEPAHDDGPNVGSEIIDSGRAVGSFIVGGVVAIGGLLGTLANPGREVVP